MKLLALILTALFALLPACYAPGAEGADPAPVGEVMAHLGTDACDGCPAGQLCGPGCATDGTVGCFVPGGNPAPNPSKWDCPSCYPYTGGDVDCSSAMFCSYPYDPTSCAPAPHPLTCQFGSAQHCVPSTKMGVECCN